VVERLEFTAPVKRLRRSNHYSRALEVWCARPDFTLICINCRRVGHYSTDRKNLIISSTIYVSRQPPATLQHVYYAADNTTISDPIDAPDIRWQVSFDPPPLLVAQPKQVLTLRPISPE